MWYLPSLIISSIIVCFFIKRNKIKYLIVISIFLFIICLLGDSYKGLVNINIVNIIINLYNIVFGTTKSGICFSLPFLTVGVIIRKYNVHVKNKFLNLFLISTTIMFFAEGFRLNYINIETARNVYCTSIVIVPLIFIRLLQSNKVINYDTSKLLRNLSLGIYYSHVLFIMIINRIYVFNNLEYFNIIRFLFVSIGSISFSYFLYKNKNSIFKILI